MIYISQITGNFAKLKCYIRKSDRLKTQIKRIKIRNLPEETIELTANLKF